MALERRKPLKPRKLPLRAKKPASRPQSASGAKSKPKTISQLKHLADKYFSLAIRYRDSEMKNGIRQGQCITCDKWVPFNQAHAGHFMSRRFNSTRFDDENVNLQEVVCNTFNAGEQYKYSLAVDLKYGDGTAKKLHEKSKEYYKLTSTELLGVIEESKEVIAFYTKV